LGEQPHSAPVRRIVHANTRILSFGSRIIEPSSRTWSWLIENQDRSLRLHSNAS